MRELLRGWEDRIRTRKCLAFWVVCVVHFSVALGYKHFAGIDIQADPVMNNWDAFWQTLPIDALMNNLAESMWSLHSQPPLYNLYGALLARLFYPQQLQAMYYSNVVLGSLLCGMMYPILRQFTRREGLSFLGALLLALNPAIYLFEAYPLYTLPTAFLVVLSVFCLTLFSSHGRQRYLYAFILCLNLLVLTRSLYHLAILFVAIPFAAILARRNWRKVLVGSIIISALSIGWYGKNCAKFGFFGSSSWSGLGLWKIAVLNYSTQEIDARAEQGVVERAVADLYPYSAPSRFVEYGFDRRSDVDVLSRDDYNNINVVAISRMYGRSAIRLIASDPLHYLWNVCGAYRTYSCPSSTYKFVACNAEKMHVHHSISSLVVHGHWLTTKLNRLIGRDPFCSLMYFYLPASLIVYGVGLLRESGKSLSKWRDRVRADAVMLFSAFMILYTTVVGCALEYGENVRFKFPIESLLWAFIIAVVYRSVVRFGGRSPLQGAPDVIRGRTG